MKENANGGVTVYILPNDLGHFSLFVGVAIYSVNSKKKIIRKITLYIMGKILRWSYNVQMFKNYKNTKISFEMADSMTSFISQYVH